MNNKKEPKYIEDMVGRTFNKVYIGEHKGENNYVTEALIFEDNDYVFYFTDVCNDNTDIDDICGDLNELVGVPLLTAEERNKNIWCDDLNKNDKEKIKMCKRYYDFDYAWTFYSFATIKGYVDVRWFADIPQYYSSKVGLIVEKK